MSDNQKIFGKFPKEGEEDKNKNDIWLPLFLSILAMTGSQPSNTMLEKEVSYLHGKVDTLEKIILERK